MKSKINIKFHLKLTLHVDEDQFLFLSKSSALVYTC